MFLLFIFDHLCFHMICVILQYSLFHEIIFQGFPIVYRWASMKTDGEACKVKSQMLETFDYAWNKVDNGKRRPNDILQMLNIISSNKLPITNDKLDEAGNNSSFVDESITKNDVGKAKVALEVEVNHQLVDDKLDEAENNSSFVDESITKNDIGTSEVALEAEVNHQLVDDNLDEAKNNSSFVDESITKIDVGMSEVVLEVELDHQLADDKSDEAKNNISFVDESVIKNDVGTSEVVLKVEVDHQLAEDKSDEAENNSCFVDESITKNDFGTSEVALEVVVDHQLADDKSDKAEYNSSFVTLEAEVDHQLAEASPLKKKGKSDKGETTKKNDGSICTKPPAEKRVSCQEHKGMRLNVFSAKAIRRSKSESEILAGSFVDESITKNDDGTYAVVLQAKIDHQLVEACPLKKKGKSDKGEANKKNVECVLEVEIGGSLWNRNFDRAGFVKDHFNLYEDFEATRKSNHSNMFHDASVSCLRSVVLLEVMEEKFQAVKSNADRLKQENEDLKLRVKTLEDQLKESRNSLKTTKDEKKKVEEDKRDVEAKCLELNNNYGAIKGEVKKDVQKIIEFQEGVENAKKGWLRIWKRGKLRSHVVIPRS
ncbi:putative transcription factor HRT family [Medicago truncatula]|uniref:Putative transcription factor HRT family n=1 Tax=Medicago truncatula TaxID=3880 RepID=A0A396HIL4_MEDTR|nr:putative transcription factor HRT family [Medicago truncatula]